MDVSEYLPMFLAEAREHLQELSLAVVRIEERPDDRETINEIFRAAHSLKGMSATMGFERIASLTHNMEDVFELLRQRSEGLSRDAIDVLLGCVDTLEDAVDHIEVEGSEQLDPTALIARLQGLVRDRDTGAPPTQAAAPMAVDRDGVIHVVARLGAEALMPSVRAFMILAAAGDHGRLASSVPAEDAVDGFDGTVVEVWVECDDAELLQASIAQLPDVAEALVVRVDDPPQVPVAAPEQAAPAPAAEAASAAEAATEAPAGRGAQRKPSGTVRVDAERLDQLMHHMAELVFQRTHVEALAGQADVPGLAQAMQELTRCSHALQHMVMQVRMIPVEAVFLRFPRLVRDLSHRLGKEVDLELLGQDTELDRTVVDAIGDPLVHLVRNALDHGLEPPEERVAAGKPQRGRLQISARHAGGSVIIGVTDDGHGIDPARVARKAAERGLIEAAQVDSVDAARACELVFAPGFSTAEQMSDVSGRGVGMDAVRAKVRELGGEVSLTSTPGDGSRIEIRLPLTLAILSTLLVRSAEGTFAIPLDRIDRTVRLGDHVVRSMLGRPNLMLDGLVVPIVDGAEVLARRPASDGEFAVLLRGAGDETVALRVDGLVGQRELVARPLPDELATPAAVSGAAVLSDGDIALIVDPDALHGAPATSPQWEPPLSAKHTEDQLDALRELANIGSGTAGTALSSILGRSVDISVPAVGAMDLEDAVETVGDPSAEVRATLVPIKGDLTGSALLIFPPEDAAKLCTMLGADPDGEDGRSALAEIGNILCASYLTALGHMLGLEIEPCPPETAWDLLGAIVATVLLGQGESEGALRLDSAIVVEGEECGLSFLLLPAGRGISELLERLGL